MDMSVESIRTLLAEGKTSLGIELGSTRIKAALIAPDASVLATGGFEWENQWVDGMWTYAWDAAWDGLRACYADLAQDVRRRYDVTLTTIGAIGISAMMHGYVALDQDFNPVVPFRTWRNTTTGEAAAALTDLFAFNIPMRWTIAHLYQAILNNEPHVASIAHITTLSGMIHHRLTGENVLGVGDVSGMFPVDPATHEFDKRRIAQFDKLIADKGYPWTLNDILPKVASAGEDAGHLTEEGAAWLDPTGSLQPGTICCPPEGDAGTGMVATNAVAPRTGNISAGTSIFAMIVLDDEPKSVHTEIDMITTPAGDPVAMVHANNGASEIGEWAEVFTQFADLAGAELTTKQVYETLFNSALVGAPDGGGLVAYNYLAGEPITGLDAGRPLIVRGPSGDLTLANFMRVQLYSAFATLAMGMRILSDEGVEVEGMFAHGGMFATKGVAQRFLAAAINAPVSVADTASEGGAWGMAVLAEYARVNDEGQTLADYLNQVVFANAGIVTVAPDPDDVAGFAAFLDRYILALPVERAAVEFIHEGGTA